jgi:hypothetical protein
MIKLKRRRPAVGTSGNSTEMQRFGRILRNIIGGEIDPKIR